MYYNGDKEQILNILTYLDTCFIWTYVHAVVILIVGEEMELDSKSEITCSATIKEMEIGLLAERE